MANPLSYGGSQPNKATAPVAAVNTLAPAVNHQKNTFYMPEPVLQTEKWADINPFMVFNSTLNDDIRFTSNVDQRPQSTFVSPVMSSFRKHRAYVAIPKSVIYQRLWHQIFVDPKKGDDIIARNCRAALNLPSLIGKFCNLPSGSSLSEIANNWIIAQLYLLYLSLSPDSLFAYLGIPIGIPRNSDGKSLSDVILAYLSEVAEGGYISTNATGSNRYQLNAVGLRLLFDDIQGGYFDDNFENLHIYDSSQQIVTSAPQYQSNFYAFFNLTGFTSFNIERVIAYQLACAQFFTSDDVDDVYTAQLYYQNLDGLVSSVFDSTGDYQFYHFEWNGISLRYEPYSASVINLMSNKLGVEDSLGDMSAFQYFRLLFEKRNSLRYGDMFNAARLQPLAVGDVTVPVSSNTFSAVDNVKATLVARFLNAVNSVRNTIKGYAQMLYGVVPDDCPIEPKFIAHSVVDFSSTLTTNTADAQGSQNVQISLHDGRPEFDIHLNQETIILGLSYYDCLMPYDSPISPFAFKIDRLDDFNPMLQNIGDQPVLGAMLYGNFNSLGSTPDTIFGYLQNDFEYKELFGRASGGYVDGSLSSPDGSFTSPSTWAMIRSPWRKSVSKSFNVPALDTGQINSSFIRNRSFEFDVFYKSLTGFGSSYYHFVCSYVNEFTPSRPMSFVSGLLFNSAI